VTPGWENFAVISGSAAGALTGLLFVAVSLNRDRIVSHPALRGEAGQTLVLFLLALLLALLLVIPGDSARILGIVLVALAIVAGAIQILTWRGGRRSSATGDAPADRLARLVDAVSPNLLTVLLTIVAGCLQIAGANGLYWVAAAEVAALVGGVVNAWLFLTR
jgi:mannose/fructose/N-acetylgalactosamine-specific phosphotransferase system component IID